MSVTFNVAYSSAKKCFICRRSDKKLHRVSFKSILYAWVYHKIAIKEGTRSCSNHLNTNNNELHVDQFQNIKPVKNKNNNWILNFLNKISSYTQNCLENEKDSESKLIFDDFKDLEKLENDHCLKITNLSKEQFCNVLNMIKDIRNSKNRTKGQLLALFR